MSYLGQNLNPMDPTLNSIIVPCHRVLAAHGRLGGFSASGGAVTKQRLLLIERARISPEAGLFDDPALG
jgi:alkylated DNA nucleotide flippase Atl1